MRFIDSVIICIYVFDFLDIEFDRDFYKIMIN